MSRAGSDDYQAELGFLEHEEARVLREIVRRLAEIEAESPDLAAQATALAEKPFGEWETGVPPQLIAAIGGLKQEQQVIGELKASIERTPLVQTLEKRVAALGKSQEETALDISGARSSEFWSEEQARAILNQLFTAWARWQRGDSPVTT